ncbi:MAG: LacI family DNA-binding transcriptional regulator [Candidatus Acidiferrales bacterium]
MARRKAVKSGVTLRDVAQESGVSPATVSIVLNNAPLARYIPPSTKDRIERAAKKLRYRPKVVSRFLSAKRNRTVGVMVFDITDPFCTLILRGIENSLYQASYLPILTDVHNQRGRFERYLEMLLARPVEALVFVANWLFVDIDILADLEKRNIPAVMIGRELSGSVSSVMTDNEAGAHLAMEHLYSLGHRKIAFIRGPKMLVDSSPRWRGVRSFARSVGLEIDPALVVDLPDSLDPNSGFEGGFKLIEELLKHKKRFTAVMAFDDMTAFGAIRGLARAGLKVPEDCSVIGFDDVMPAGLSVPSLTTVRQPMEALGSASVGIVLEAINATIEEREFEVVHRKLAPELVVRESSRSVPWAGAD